MYGSFSEMGEPLLGAPKSGALYGPQCFNNGDSHGKKIGNEMESGIVWGCYWDYIQSRRTKLCFRGISCNATKKKLWSQKAVLLILEILHNLTRP